MPSVALRGGPDVVENISLPEEPLSCGDQFPNAKATHFPESAEKDNPGEQNPRIVDRQPSFLTYRFPLQFDYS
jgi:hypothetical protein